MKFDSQMAVQAILLVVYFCQFGFVHLVSPVCKNNQYQHASRCCDKCRPGTFVLSHCNETSRTVCEDCKDGFSQDWSSSTKCKPCGSPSCQPTMGLVQQCNSTVDNKCGCIAPNRYHDLSTDSCRSCTPCPAGKYAIKPCSAETICDDCPSGRFSNISENYNRECVPCTKCEVYDTVCTSKKDAVCADDLSTTSFSTEWPTTLTDTSKPSTKTAEKLTPSHSHPRKETILDPKIIAVIVVVVVVIIFIAGVVYLRKKKATSRCSKRQGFEIIQESKRESFSFGGLLLREQPATILLNLHAYLNPKNPNDWKKLAAELDIKYQDILNFATNADTAASDMLNFWGTSNEATLDRLHKALRKMGRDDVCTFLETNVERRCEETIV